MILCQSRYCSSKPSRLVDNYCIGISLRCGRCANSTIMYYDRQYNNSPKEIYPEFDADFWENQIITVQNILDVEILDRQQGPYFKQYILSSKHKKILQGLVI